MYYRRITIAVMLFIYFILSISVGVAKATNTIDIGVLVDLSGPLSTYGNDIKNTLEIAREDINEYFEKEGLPYRVEFYFEDTQVNPTITLRKVQELYSKGIRLIIGPMGSGEIANIKDYVTSNKIIMVSPSSTALPSIIGFTKPEVKRYVFRFIGTDDLQCRAIVDELKSIGIKGVVVVCNVWGKSLYECMKPQLNEAGIEIAKVVEYSWWPQNISQCIAELESGIRDLLGKYNVNQVAVIALGYEEIYTIIAQIDANSDLFKVIWFGCDGCVKSKEISKVCDKVAKIGMYSTLFDSKGSAYAKLKKEYQKRGYEGPYQYGLNAYDAAWVLALAYVETVKRVGKFDPDFMVRIIPDMATRYSRGEFGVQPASGIIKLNEWNDRVSGSYAIWYVNESCKWDLAGVWHSENETIDWYHPPQIVVNLPPIANFSIHPISVLVGESVTFNASLSYDPDRCIMKYIWNFGDGNVTVTDTPIVVHKYSREGKYTVKLTVVDNDNMKSSTVKSITVKRQIMLIASIQVKDLPRRLTFNEVHVPKNYLEYGWALFIDVDNNRNTGSIWPVKGCELAIGLSHFKFPNSSQHFADIINGTQHDVWIPNPHNRSCWFSGYPYDLNVTVNYAKNTINIVVKGDTGPLMNITENSRFCVVTEYYSPNGSVRDNTSFVPINTTVFDAVGDVPYGFIDIIRGTLTVKGLTTQISSGCKYDFNRNGKIDDEELLSAIMDWLNSKLSDIDLLNIIMKWLQS